MTPFHDLPIVSDALILFHSEDIDFSLSTPDKIVAWIISAIQNEDKKVGALNFIFCSDDYLHKINVEYLNHDTYTDVITFPYSESSVEGDIFISIDRIKENAKSFGVSFEEELNRVIIHGILHIIGYSDKSVEEKRKMSLKEDEYLFSLKSM